MNGHYPIRAQGHRRLNDGIFNSLLRFGLLQQIVDPLRFIFAFVVNKFDGGDKAKVELLAHFGTDESRSAL
jgi:hypothetical protein